MAASTSPTEWQKYSKDFEKSLKSGDLVEVNEGAYSHWTMYEGNGHIVDFNPSEPRDENYLESQFRSGAVRRTPLKTQAENFDIRVNNLAELNVRPLEDTLKLMTALPNGRGFRYNGSILNCQVFAKFLKFQIESEEELDILAEQVEAGCLKNEGVSREQFLEKLARAQWRENFIKVLNQELPRRIMERGIEIWDK